jgi:hypothetical protein
VYSAISSAHDTTRTPTTTPSTWTTTSPCVAVAPEGTRGPRSAAAESHGVLPGGTTRRLRGPTLAFAAPRAQTGLHGRATHS